MITNATKSSRPMLDGMLKLALLVAVCAGPACSFQQGQDPQQQQKPQPADPSASSHPPAAPPIGPGESSSAKPEQTGDPTAPQAEPTPEPATTPTPGAKRTPSHV